MYPIDGQRRGTQHVALVAMTILSLFAGIAPASAVEQDTRPLAVEFNVREGSETLGVIVIELDVQAAPIAADSFLRYAEDGFYDGTLFQVHTDALSGGRYASPNGSAQKGLRPGIPNEWAKTMRHRRGSVGLAWAHRAKDRPGTVSAEFFINVRDRELGSDGGQSVPVIGRVTEGMDLIDRISKVKCESTPFLVPGNAVTWPVVPIRVTSARILGQAHRASCARHAERQLAKVEQKEAEAQHRRNMIRHGALSPPGKLSRGDLMPQLDTRVNWAEGTPIRSWKGTGYHLVVFSTSYRKWGFCHAVMPLLGRLQEHHPPDKLRIVAVDVNVDVHYTHQMGDYRKAWGTPLNYTVALDHDLQVVTAIQQLLDILQGPTGIEYRTDGGLFTWTTLLPYAVLVDPEGRIAWWGGATLLRGGALGTKHVYIRARWFSG